MTINEIFKDNHLLLPKTVPNDKSYREFLKDTLGKYLQILASISPKSIKIKGMKGEINFSNILNIQNKVVSALLETVDYYYKGYPSQAYIKFEEMLNYRTSKYKKLLNIKELEMDENFYRIRVKKENFPLSASEMFHIPFEHRGKVSTQRYSIPGFPCLYLGKTIYVAWEELKRPNLDEFQVIRLRSVKKIRLLNLTSEDWGNNDINKTAYKYLMTWPIIAACSIRVSNYADTFKPEYIIPQLLLQWVRNNQEMVDGLMYNSTHIKNKKLTTEGELYNVVLPVRDNKDKGHCQNLLVFLNQQKPFLNSY
uniref:RES domain-containing protein n=1 Tax=Pedobacter schmidteae TaxID=2201271 RepID=UPI000EB4A62A|nr:RES domain-containing protein [Pedobacter schmidteae]